MATRTEKERRKQEQDMLQRTLNELLREEDNRYCADCDAKGPRWASWNLGVFLCIRCAGIHRNLGVHVSKVKSVNLDTWTPEQVAHVQVMGNSVARGVYEAHLPENFRRPQSDSSMEAFIRAKYDHKRYTMKDWIPPRIDPRNWPRLEEPGSNPNERKKHGSGRSGGRTKSTSSNDGANVIKGLAPPPGNTSGSVAASATSAKNGAKSAENQVVAEPSQAAGSGAGTGSGGGALVDLVDLSFGPTTPAVAVQQNGALPGQQSAATIMQAHSIQDHSTALDDMLGLNHPAPLGSAGSGPAPPVQSPSTNLATGPLPTTTTQSTLHVGGLSDTVQRSSEADLNNLIGSHPSEGSTERKSKADILALYGSTHSLPGSLLNGSGAALPPQSIGVSTGMFSASGTAASTPHAGVYQQAPVASFGGFESAAIPSIPSFGQHPQPTMNPAFAAGQQFPQQRPMAVVSPQQGQYGSAAMFANSNPFGYPAAASQAPPGLMAGFPNNMVSPTGHMGGAPLQPGAGGPAMFLPPPQADFQGAAATAKQQHLSKIQSQLAGIQISSNHAGSTATAGTAMMQQTTLASSLWK